jgi:uncharacterized protein YjdB
MFSKKHYRNIVLASAIVLTALFTMTLLRSQAYAATKISLNKKSVTIYVGGDTETLKLNGATKKVSWTSSNKNIVTVSPEGKLTAIKAGTATITAVHNNIKYTCKVTVKNIKITLNITSGILSEGETYQLIPKGAKAADIKWSSSDSEVVFVDNKGDIIGNRVGKATITAAYGNSKATCKIDVVNFDFNAYGKTFEPGEYYKLTVTPRGKKVSYTWESSDTAKATVDNSGNVYAVPGEGGEAEIRIAFKTLNGTSYKSTTVNVLPFSSLYSYRNIKNNRYKTAAGTVTNSFTDGMDADISLLDADFDKCSSDYYEHVGGMAYVRKDGFDYYFVSDTWNNRVVVFRVNENETWNGPSVSSKIYCVLGQKNTTSRKAGSSLGSMNWPVGVTAAVAGDKIKVYVADAKNNRILVWEDLPKAKQHGVPADFSIMQKYDASKINYENNNTTLINESTAAVAWPWGLWTDGKRLICTSTQDGYVLIWDDELPTITDKYPDKIIYTSGTPRNIICKGNYLLLGDHNIQTKDGRMLAATRVFKDISKLKYISIYNKEDSREKLFDYCRYEYDFVYTDNNSGQPSGIFLTNPLKTEDGSILKEGTLLLHEAGAISVWKDGTIDNENDRPDYYIGGGSVDDDRIHYFIGGDSSPIIQDMNGNIYTSGMNTGKIEGFKAGTFPGEPSDVDYNSEEIKRLGGDVVIYNGAYYWNRRDIGVIEKHCIQLPNICIGAKSVDEEVYDTLFHYQNCELDSNGRYLVALSDYHQQIYLWKDIPDESSAKPDVIYTFKYSVEDITMFENNGKTGLLVVGRQSLYCWNDIEDAFSNKVPDNYLYQAIGTVKAEFITSIDYCDGYFYMIDGSKLYCFKGIPGKTTAPAASMELPFNDGNIHVTKCNDGKTYIGLGATQDKAYIINAADFMAGNGNKYKMTIEGAWQRTIRSRKNGIDTVEEVFRSFNGASEVFITETGQVIVSDTGFCRVIIWDSIEDALSEVSKRTRMSSAILGLGSNHYSFFDVRDADASNSEFELGYDVIGVESRNTLFAPKFIDYDGKYLWVGNFKFAGGIKRFSGLLK